MPVNAVLLDIEGTTTPIDFVHKVLFPFAKARIADFVSDNFEQLAQEIDQLKAEHSKDDSFSGSFDACSPDSVSQYLQYLIDVDRKSTPLKSIQGQIWQAGYEAGELRSQVFDDVPEAFETLRANNKTIAIYSSGSVQAQKDLFAHTVDGDLTPFISCFFDTNVGGKKESQSYTAIAEELKYPAGEILFVSDIPAELDAARVAGMQTALSIRDGNFEVAASVRHRKIRDLTEI